MTQAETERDDPVVSNDDATPRGEERRVVTLVERHSVVVRLTHWSSVPCLTMLLMCGL